MFYITYRSNHYEIGPRYWGETAIRDENLIRDGSKEFRPRNLENVPFEGQLREQAEEEIKRKEQKAPKEVDPVMTRTGGAYIPPARLRLMQAQITDKSSLAFQRLSWEALKKSIHGLINKVNVSNIPLIIASLFKENIVRGRGLLSRSIIQAQAASPTFTHVYAALVAVINSKVFLQSAE